LTCSECGEPVDARNVALHGRGVDRRVGGESR